MVDKYQLLTETYLTAIAELTAGAENWQRFLTIAGTHYQVPFAEQVLIYAQRPTATKVMTMQEWNEKGYWIRRGSKGIAVFDHPLSKRAICYYFDAADTYVGQGYEGEKLATLDLAEQEKGYITGGFRRRNQKVTSFAQAINHGAHESAEQAIEHYRQRITENLLDRNLVNQQEVQVRQELKNLLTDSVAYMLLARLEPESLAENPATNPIENPFDLPAWLADIFAPLFNNPFAGITKYQTVQAANTLGVCLSFASKSLIKEILKLQKQAQVKFAQAEQVVYSESSKENPEYHPTQIQAQQLTERSNQDGQQLNVSRGERHPHTQPGYAEPAGAGLLRQTEAEIPDGLSGDRLHHAVNDRQAERPLTDDSKPSGRNERPPDGTDGESRSDNRSTETKQPNVKRNNISYNMNLPVWRAIFLPCSKKPYFAGFAVTE